MYRRGKQVANPAICELIHCFSHYSCKKKKLKLLIRACEIIASSRICRINWSVVTINSLWTFACWLKKITLRENLMTDTKQANQRKPSVDEMIVKTTGSLSFTVSWSHNVMSSMLTRGSRQL